MPRSKINLEEDEYLTLEVKKFKCLYDKQCSAYKDKRAKCNAWSLVDTSLGIEEGKYYILNAYSRVIQTKTLLAIKTGYRHWRF